MTDVTKAFETALNRHGYGFQYAVIRQAKSAYDSGKSGWILDPAEFPIAVQGRDGRIDFILRAVRTSYDLDLTDKRTLVYLVAECKRVDPALGHWCFARAPYVSLSKGSDHLLVEHVFKAADGNLYSGVGRFPWSGPVYHIAQEIKTGQPGDGSGTGRDTIEKAATQACLGMSGLIERCRRPLQSNRPATHKSFVVIPVIFTTARLFATEVDLGTADIESGSISLSNAPAVEKPWVCLQYPMSVSLRHSFTVHGDKHDLNDILYAEFLRSILVVTATKVEDFLKSFTDHAEQIVEACQSKR